MESESAGVQLANPPSHGSSASSRGISHSAAFDLLSSEEALTLGLDEEGRKRLAPILHLPCQRTASTGRRLDREIVLTASGTLLLLRPSPAVPRIANISHRILLCDGRHDCRFFTATDESPEGKSTARTQVVVSTFQVDAHHHLLDVDAVVPTEIVELWFNGGPGESDRLYSLLQCFSRRCSGLSVRACDSLYQSKRRNQSLSVVSPFLSAWRFLRREHPTGATGNTALSAARESAAEQNAAPSARVDSTGGSTASDAYRPSKLLLESLPRSENVPLSLLRSRKPLPDDQRRRIREQLNTWCRKFAPDEAFLVDDVLLKYKGMEDWLESKVRQRLPVLEQPEQDSSDADPERAIRSTDNVEVVVDSTRSKSGGAGGEVEGVSAVEGVGANGDCDAVELLDGILFDISVLERACDRIAWRRGEANANGTGTSAGVANQGTAHHGNARNLYETKRKEAQALAKLIVGICARRTKEALHNEEERLHQSFVELLEQNFRRPS